MISKAKYRWSFIATSYRFNVGETILGATNSAPLTFVYDFIDLTLFIFLKHLKMNNTIKICFNTLT